LGLRRGDHLIVLELAGLGEPERLVEPARADVVTQLD
jgi:hypothetical protein